MIVYLTRAFFPSKGGSSANRILGIAKGLVANGERVVVLTFGSETGRDEQFEMDGVEITTFSNAKCDKRRRGVVGGLFLRFLVCSCLWIWRNRRSIDAVMFYDFMFLFALVGWLICRFCGIRYYNELNECPPSLFYAHRRIVRLILLWKDLRVFPRLFDGMLVMTHYLMNYYKPFVRKGCRLIHVPMTVDASRFGEDIFELAQTNPEEKDYVAYCGMIAHNKDGVGGLIRSFAFVAQQIPEVKLMLIGRVDRNERASLDNLVKTYNIGSRVVFTGSKPREEMPRLLARAKVLLLARPSSERAAAGFPSKMGEYLLTGVPVLTTDVGEISQYLQNGVNAYVVPPDDPERFGLELVSILRHYKDAVGVGRAGRSVALKYFSCEKNAKIFLDGLRNR